MERLTFKFEGLNALRELGTFNKENVCIDCASCAACCEEFNFIRCDCSDCPIQKAFDKLAAYEDAEEQGLLLMLPVTIGSIVYSVTRDFISEYTVCNIEKYKEGFFFNWVCEKGIYINVRGFTSHDIGKTVFLTKVEAEAALQAIKEDKQ